MSTVTYQLANTAGYKFNITKIGHHHYDELAYYHKDNFPDLEVTRPGTSTDMTLLHTKALMTVNGYLYLTTVIDDKLYIPNATASMVKSRANSIGILSFNTLSNPISKIKLTEDMITAEGLTSLYDKVIITLDEDIAHPILSICGYMIFEHPEFFYRVGENSFALRLDRLNYMEKLYELNKFRNIFEELEVPTSLSNNSVVDPSVARSDAVITKFLTTYNSFIVNVPVNAIEVNKIYLEHSTIPGNFRTQVEPKLPILAGQGKITEYHRRKTNDTKYSVTISDPIYQNYLFSKMSTENIGLYNAHREVGNTYDLVNAFFLQINLTE
jgi:hypothetical protein